MRALLLPYTRAANLRTRCKLQEYLGTLFVIIATIKRPQGKNKNFPEASGMIGNHKKT